MTWARMTEDRLSILRNNVERWLQLYQQDEIWVPHQPDFKDCLWYKEIPALKRVSVKLVPGDHTTDLENSKRLFTALCGIPRSLATDESFWAYLTHVTFWDYMRVRWRDSTTPETILERYFFGSSKHRALVRNGISRLWWYAYITYDPARKDPFELTAVLVRRISVAQAILERSWSSNPMIVQAVLSAIKRAEELYPNRFPARQVLRDDLQAYINQIGGVTILDALRPEEIETLAFERISRFVRLSA